VIPTPPRNAWITVTNPGPGGGTSNRRAFMVNDPFLGESELLAPPTGSSRLVGEPVAFAALWTHPTDSWRTMRHMDLRLIDADERIAAWVRVVEGEGATSTFHLLDADGSVVDGGLPGEERDLTVGGATLHLNDSRMSGSGPTVTIEPQLTFAAGSEGTYRVEVQIEDKGGEVQDAEIVGTFVVAPEGCEVVVQSVAIVPDETPAP